VLVALQVAFTLALMITATLVVRSFVNLRRIDLGFVPDKVVTMGLEPRGVAGDQVNRWTRDLIERLRALPGVEAAGAVYLRPLALGPIGQETWVVLDGQANDEETRRRSPTLNYEVATPGYFTAMRVPLLRGRLFTDDDRPGQPRVAIVGASAARRLWPGQDPIGKRVLLPTFIRGDKVPIWRTVVGVVSDVRYRGLDDVRLDIYDAAMQAATPATDLVVRASGDPLRLIAAIEAEARGLDPRVVIDRVTTMGAIIDKETAPWRFSVWVLSLFGAIAFALAGVGLFGLVALDVGERAREFAIRLALGARRRDVIRSAMTAAAVRVAAGLAAGTLGAVAIGRAIRSMLFGVTPLDVPSFAIAVALVALVVGAASFVPARRAASIDPLKLLRGDAAV
jgi:putative ABC transport system permease protein